MIYTIVIPKWSKDLGNKLMKTESEIHAIICEMAKSAAQKHKKNDLDRNYEFSMSEVWSEQKWDWGGMKTI